MFACSKTTLLEGRRVITFFLLEGMRSPMGLETGCRVLKIQYRVSHSQLTSGVGLTDLLEIYPYVSTGPLPHPWHSPAVLPTLIHRPHTAETETPDKTWLEVRHWHCSHHRNTAQYGPTLSVLQTQYTVTRPAHPTVTRSDTM